MSNLKVKFLKHQHAFITDTTTRHLLLLSGYGAGKTYALLSKVIRTALINKGTNILLLAPNLQMQSKIHVPDLEVLLTQWNVKWEYKKQEKTFKIGDSNVYLISMEDPSIIVGYNASAAFLDELDLVRKDKAEEVMTKVQGRIRQHAPINQINVTSTAEGFSFLYEFFHQNPAPDRRIIHAKSTDNKYLPPEYIESLFRNYTKQQVEAYVNGLFVNLNSGSVYNDYHILDNEIRPDLTKPLYVGVDFNIKHTSAVVYQELDKGKLTMVDEVIDQYDTFTLVETINSRYGDRAIIQWAPDAAGQQRKSSATQTDHQILLTYPDSKMLVGPTNPPIQERVNTCNYNFRENKVEISPHCVKTIDALRRQSWKHGIPDKTIGVDHVLDAMGYAICKLLPMRLLQRPKVQVNPIPTVWHN